MKMNYEKLPLDEGSLPQGSILVHDWNQPPCQETPSRKMLNSGHKLCLAIAVVICVAAFGFWFLHAKSTQATKYTWTDCGRTPTEARAHGCHYEPMQRSWIPPECFFSEPMDEYNVFRDREWFKDENLTIPADIEGLESGDVELAYTRYWHNEHCIYAMRKLALAVALRKPMINSTPANIHHTKHCVQSIIDRIVNSYNGSFLQIDKTYTETYLAYESCVPLQVRPTCHTSILIQITSNECFKVMGVM
jgi:hypothetical protein